MSAEAVSGATTQPQPHPTPSTSLNNQEERPQRDEDDEERGEGQAGCKDGYQCNCLPSGLFGHSLLVENRGSTGESTLRFLPSNSL